MHLVCLHLETKKRHSLHNGCHFNMCIFFSLLRLIPKFLWRCLKTWNDNYNWYPWMRWHGTCLIPRGFDLEYVFTFIACRNCKGYKLGISNIRDPCLSRYDKDSLNSKAESFEHTSMSKYVVLHVVTYPCMYMSERFSSGTLNNVKLNSQTKVFSIWIMSMYSMLFRVFRNCTWRQLSRLYK